MKGISLGMNMVVIIAISVVVIASLVAFFTSGSLSTISDVEAQRIFSGGCAKYCTSDLYVTLQNAVSAAKNDKDFVNACVKLGYITKGSIYMNRCIDKCGNCNLDINGQDIDNAHGMTLNIARG